MRIHSLLFPRAFCRSEGGQAMTEYGLIIALVVLLVMGGLLVASGQISRLYEDEILSRFQQVVSGL